MPDFSTRVTYSPGSAFHVDAGGVLRVFRHTVAPYDDDFKAAGGGVSVNARVNPTKTTKIFGQWAVGSGLGRYIGGLIPDAAFDSDGSINLIDTISWVGGVEQSLTDRVSVAGYLSGVNTDGNLLHRPRRQRHRFRLSPAPRAVNNRSIQECTATGAYQIVRTPDRGSAQFNAQVSWLTREPLSTPQTGLSSARSFLFLAQVRYNLP